MVFILFNILLLILPLTFFPKTSEIFEFNKIVLVYIFTAVIVGFWVTGMIFEKRIIFRRTILDLPICIFLISQLISTLVSIDTRTSLFGYYSRFNGGLISSLSYTLLYWAFVSNIAKEHFKKLLTTILISGSLVSLVGFLEHFNISLTCLLINGDSSASCWIQDVVRRVFSTFGQPNWLASYLVLVMPLSWWFFISHKDFRKRTFYLLISGLFLATLVFTQSRSGYLGFLVEYVLFWTGFVYFSSKKVSLKLFLLQIIVFIGVTGLFGTPWGNGLIDNQVELEKKDNNINTQLEKGGTESGEIRKIVWRGAIDVWLHYPFFGSGVETFAFSYYKFKPSNHNLTSEWNYLYNKAHNEYLNYLATSGAFGLFSYTLFLGSIYLIFLRTLKKVPESIAFFAAISGYLISIFFGFSVVVTSLLLFLYPALIVIYSNDRKSLPFKRRFYPKQKFLLLLTSVVIFLGGFVISIYWFSDYLYAKGVGLIKTGDFTNAARILSKAASLSHGEPIYQIELAKAYLNLGVILADSDPAEASKLIDEVNSFANSAYQLSPYNTKVLREISNIYVDMSEIDEKYLAGAVSLGDTLSQLAPNDALMQYIYAASLVRAGESYLAIDVLNKTVELKPDYVKARMLLGFLYVELGSEEIAKREFEEVLRLEPSNKIAKDAIDAILSSK